MIIGIDIGSTTTKAVAVEETGGNERQIRKIKTHADDAVASATGAFGKMIVENQLEMKDIERIMITGAGSSKIAGNLFGIPTRKVDEIQAIGIGGMFQAGQDNIIITNIGTGTAIIDARRDRIVHIGGSAVGGGTIQGLAKKLLPTREFSGIMELADRGDLGQVDLRLEDIMDTGLSFLNGAATASNFGKMLDSAKNEDIALGIINMVYQVIGVLSVFAARYLNTDRVLVTGNGSDNTLGKEVLSAVSAMYHIQFEYPQDAAYTTAIGAGLFKPQE
ncbi:MAG: pantothenate kinase [Spirochaetales bacterium]|jgi:type II pantothenate kinase|nr:pantothenate kinase [Spirochaetales bacterium]